jgi:LytS/YehU family sensor histidine kinase
MDGKVILKYSIVILIGAVAGYSYWYFVGCNSGSCAITSSPLNSSIYGGLVGGLFLNSFSRKKKE